MRYTLTFNCHMSFPSAEDNSLPNEAQWIDQAGTSSSSLPINSTSIKAEFIEEAMTRFLDGSTWYNYLVSSHAGAMEDDGEGEEFPEISEIEIVLGEPSEDGKFSGTISWTADEVDLEELDEKLDWFIGDRMCFYEVGDHEEGWHCHVSPSGLKGE